jgi:hypothetical protein
VAVFVVDDAGDVGADDGETCEAADVAGDDDSVARGDVDGVADVVEAGDGLVEWLGDETPVDAVAAGAEDAGLGVGDATLAGCCVDALDGAEAGALAERSADAAMLGVEGCVDGVALVAVEGDEAVDDGVVLVGVTGVRAASARSAGVVCAGSDAVGVGSAASRGASRSERGADSVRCVESLRGVESARGASLRGFSARALAASSCFALRSARDVSALPFDGREALSLRGAPFDDASDAGPSSSSSKS